MFERAQKIADAVMLEGYVLYPYRLSSAKNRYRWTFGVLSPQSWSEAGGSEPWWLEAQCLVKPEAETEVRGRLRFLQIRDRRIEEANEGVFTPTDHLIVDGESHVPFEEGELREIDFHAPVSPDAGTLRIPFDVPGGRETETLTSGGRTRGRVIRSQSPVSGVIEVRSERDGDLLRLSVRVENLSECEDPRAPRAAVMSFCCASTHLLLACEGGSFVSLIDPPPAHKAAAARCKSVGTHPVLTGDEGSCDLVLAGPLIMYDHPQIAPESPGDFFDATEIDELLVLRTMTLTPEEKTLARATDPRAAALLDRVETLSPEGMQRLHGTMREGPHGYEPGSRVRLRPGVRRTDAQDLLFAGCTATVQKVMQDVDGRDHLAVTIDGDPAADHHRWYGRFHYYFTDEVEPLEEGV